MKGFFNRHCYILIGLVPITIYCLSCFLFESNAETSVQVKKLILENVSKASVSPVMILDEFKARILWQCSSLLSITAYFFAMIWSCLLLCKCCVSGSQIKNIVVMGSVVVALTLLQVVNANPNSAMYNVIFSSTYEALKVSPLLSQTFQQKAYLVISLINLLAVSTPVFILVAVCGSICITEETTDHDMNFFINRMNYLNQGIAAGSIILVFGIIHMIAWMQWPQALIGETDFGKALLDSVSATSQFWGITFTLLLISLYISAVVVLNSRVQHALDTLLPNEDRQKWLKDNGFTISFQKHIMQFGMMFMPSLAGSFSSVFELI